MKTRPGETFMTMPAGSSTNLSLKTLRCELNYTAAFERPVYRALPSEGVVYSAIYDAFEKYGARVEDIRPEAVSTSPADLSIVCALTAKGALVRFRLDRIEVWLSGTPSTTLAELAEAALNGLARVSPDSRVATHTVTILLHGTPRRGDLSSWMAANGVIVPEGAPVFRPAGIAFACPLDEGGEGSLVVERSLAFANAVFVKTVTLFPGKLQASAVFAAAMRFFLLCRSRFNFDVESEESHG